MAKCKKSNYVLLGFEDEPITDKNKSNVGYWSNKFGGCPDWPVERIRSPNCQLCGLTLPLVVQIYAPLENSPFHRTLYVFGCINPNCWNHNESWTCLRGQLLDTEYEVSESPTVNIKSATDWGTEADNWDDSNGNFENGNIINPVMNQHSPSDNESDDDSSSLSGAMGNLSVDEANANWGGVVEKSSGAVGELLPPVPTAEIEAEESEVITVDPPAVPMVDLFTYFEETAPVPHYMASEEWNRNNSVEFVPFFISVGEETIPSQNSEHVRELMQEYRRNHGEVLHHRHNQGREESQIPADSEDYEKSVPIHGDKMFHRFMNKIHSNPGQILRYSRDSEPPLLLYPLEEPMTKCRYCNGDMIFEMQLLPTLIPKCRFQDEDQDRLEFGTVLIFTCKRSCWSYEDKFREERVIIQREKIETYPTNYLKSINYCYT